MSNEDFERQMEFMLKQQAQFSADLAARDAESKARHAESKARHAQWEARMDRVDRQIEQLVGFAGTLRDALVGLTHHIERHDQAIERDVQAIERHNQAIERHDRAVADLDRQLAEQRELGRETDARLAALRIIVERQISDHQ